MCAARMHADEVETDACLVRTLIAAQFPQWRDLTVEPVESAGTDNAMYRLGTDLVVRLPRLAGAAANVDAEQRWLPRLAPLLPVDVPVPLGQGSPGEGYPWDWSVCRWLDGTNPDVTQLADPGLLARDLARSSPRCAGSTRRTALLPRGECHWPGVTARPVPRSASCTASSTPMLRP